MREQKKRCAVKVKSARMTTTTKVYPSRARKCKRENEKQETKAITINKKQGARNNAQQDRRNRKLIIIIIINIKEGI